MATTTTTVTIPPAPPPRPMTEMHEAPLKSGERTPTSKRNWVLSDNFYLLESPKTWRDKQRSRTAANRRIGGPGRMPLFEVDDGRINCDQELLLRIGGQSGAKRRYGQQLQSVASINCNGLLRSTSSLARNSLDFRESTAKAGDETSVS